MMSMEFAILPGVLIAVGHNLRGQKDSTRQAKAMTQMFLVRGYYVDRRSQANSYKQQNKHMEIVHHW